MRIILLKQLLFFLTLMVLIVGQGAAQYVVTGNYDCKNRHILFTPVQPIPANTTYDLDLDGDAQADFKIQTFYYTGLGPAGSSSAISPIGSNEIAFGRVDSSYCLSGSSWIFYQIPRAFNISDTINSRIEWRNYILEFCRNGIYVFSGGSYCSYGTTGIEGNNKYIGLRIINSNDTLYGWVKFKVVASGYLELEEIVCEVKQDEITFLQTIQDTIVQCGESFQYNVSVISKSCANYQWSKDGVNIIGATSDSLYFNPISLSDSGIYSCQVSTFFDTIIETAKLTVQIVLPTIPNVSILPYTNWGCEGEYGYKFWLEGNLTNIVSYQWTKNGIDIPNADSSSISFGSLVLSDSANYSCKLGAILSIHCPDSIVLVNFETTSVVFGVKHKPEPKITQIGNKLISNYPFGNAWYFQDSFTNEYLSSSQQIDIVKEGQYLVVVNNDYCIGSTNFKDYYFEFNVTPNPFEDEIILSVKREQLYTSWELVDDLGITVLKGSLTSLQNSINTSTIAKGHYYLKINGQVMKMIKQ